MAGILTALKGYLNPKVLVFLGLGLASQAPVNLIGGTLKYWFSQEGVDLAKIALFGLVLIPYAFKFLWAPLIDHINLPFARLIGRKKAWGLAAQIGIMVLLFLLSLSHPVEDQMRVFLLCFAIAVCSSTQDIVIDALRIDTLEGNTLKEGSAVYQLGARLGFLLAVAGMIFLSARVSWEAAYQISIGMIAVGVVSLCLVREKKAAVSRISFYDYAVAPFQDLIRRENFLTLCVFIVLYKLCNGMLGPMAYPFYYQVGFTADDIALVSGTFGVFVTMAGIFAGGLLMVRYPYRPMLIWLGILEILTSFSFAGLACVGSSLIGFFIVILFDNLVGGIGGAVWVGFLSGLCSRTYSATQYAFLIALTMVPLSVIASSSGWFAKTLGWPGFFVMTGFLMIPALIMLRFMKLKQV